jgi:hypothetical protein
VEKEKIIASPYPKRLSETAVNYLVPEAGLQAGISFDNF